MIPAVYRPVLANRAYRLLAAGLFVSRLCDHLTWLGWTWLILDLTESATAIGGIVLATQLPAALTGPFVGSLLDRFHRFAPMVADNLLRGMLVLAVPLLALVGALEVWHVYLLGVLASALMPISEAGGRALIPEIVDRADLPAANALDQMLWQVSFIVGPALMGVLMARLGTTPAFVVVALLFIVVAAIIARLARLRAAGHGRVHGRGLAATGEAAALHTSVLAGARVVRRHAGIRALLALTFGLNLTYGPLDVVLPIYAEQVLRAGAAGLGALWSAFAAGSLIGVLAVGSRVSQWRRSRVLAACVVAWGVVVLPLAWIEQLTAALVLLFIAGVVFAPFTVLAVLTIQETVPMEYRGRVFGVVSSATRAGIPFGAAIGGLLLPLLGLPGTILASGISSAAAGVIGFRSAGLRQLDGVSPMEGAAGRPVGLPASAVDREAADGWRASE